jgi:hypothetical protein
MSQLDKLLSIRLMELVNSHKHKHLNSSNKSENKKPIK